MTVDTSARNGAGANGLDLLQMLKEAAIAAGIVFALGVVLVGFHIVDVPGGLAIRGRPADVAAAVVLAFVGRIALILIRTGRPAPVAAAAGGYALVLAWSNLAGEAAPAALLWARPFENPVVNWMVCLAGASFAARAASLLRRGPAVPGARTAGTERLAAGLQRATVYIAPVVLLGAILLPLAPFADRRVVDLGILVLTYVMLGWGLNIVVGLAGLLDLGYVAFYAVGAYSYAILARDLGVGFWVCLPFAGMMAATAGVALGFPVLRLRGDYLAIVTLGFGEMIRLVLLNWHQFTNGARGVSGIPRPSFFGLEFDSTPAAGTQSFHTFFGLEYQPIHRIVFLYYLILALALLTNWFTLRIRRMPIGRAWEALREDEIACRSLGINPTNTKLTAFSIGAMFGGFAGSFFAARQGFISPENFTFIESAVILAIVVLGGMGSQIGVVLAALLLIALPELFRDLQEYRMLVFGFAMVMIMIWRPGGLLAHREPSVRLPPGRPR